MLDRVAARVVAAARRVRRLERRELREFRRWIQTTSNLVHLSILAFVPLLIAAVTALSNSVAQLSFLLFPPLASGTYTLFADPEGRYASPVKFVGGLTVGALCGWFAIVASAAVGSPPGPGVSPFSAALSVLLTGLATWGLGVEEPSAFSTALLVLVTDFLDANAAAYDLVFVGASRDWSAASRLVAPPTFRRIRDVDCGVAIVDRGRP